MGLFNLPKKGNTFRMSNTPSSFTTKLKSLTRVGELKNLNDNLPELTKAFKEYEGYIKKGGLSYSQRCKMWNKIRKNDKNLSEDDKREIKKIIEQFKK